jgi:hypothetical protein
MSEIRDEEGMQKSLPSRIHREGPNRLPHRRHLLSSKASASAGQRWVSWLIYLIPGRGSGRSTVAGQRRTSASQSPASPWRPTHPGVEPPLPLMAITLLRSISRLGSSVKNPQPLLLSCCQGQWFIQMKMFPLGPEPAMATNALMRVVSACAL